MSTIGLTFPSDPDLDDIRIAELDALGSIGFEQRKGFLLAFFEKSVWKGLGPDAKVLIENHVGAKPIVEHISDRNWNEEWKRTIRPIRTGPFVIRPTWHEAAQIEPDDSILELIVDPKMSFGTGYHESTRLVLGKMPEFISPGDQVLDAGTGTGILGIAAVRLGAESAIGFDVDLNSFDNACENAILNGVSDRFRIELGDIVDVEASGFDVILANINRETLRGMLPDLKEKLAPGGVLAFSGILCLDAWIMKEAFESAGLELISESEEGSWWSAWCRVRNPDCGA